MAKRNRSGDRKPGERTVVLNLRPEVWTVLDMACRDNGHSMRAVISSIVDAVVVDDIREEKKRAA